MKVVGGREKMDRGGKGKKRNKSTISNMDDFLELTLDVLESFDVEMFTEDFLAVFLAGRRGHWENGGAGNLCRPNPRKTASLYSLSCSRGTPDDAPSSVLLD
jgi:hypothetical protein